MTYQTLVAAFDSGAHAKAAADALRSAGFHAADVSVLTNEVDPGAWTGMCPGAWQGFYGSGMLQHEAAVYDHVLERGGAVVSVRVPDDEVAHATGILDLHHPIDIHDRALTSGIADAARVQAAIAAAAPVLIATRQMVAVSPKLQRPTMRCCTSQKSSSSLASE